jgi:RNA polymerase sigma factor (sigma-70 family)
MDRDTAGAAAVAVRCRHLGDHRTCDGRRCQFRPAGTVSLATAAPPGVSLRTVSEPGSIEEDRALADAVLRREPGAFEHLVQRYQGLCWHIVQRMVRHPEDARELCQDAFLRVHQCLHQYRGDSALSGWIGQVAYSVARRHLERKRIPIAEHADGEASPLDAVADAHELEAGIAGEQEDAALHAAIERLPPLQRTVLTLYHLEEMPIGEISRITDLPENTIKSHLFRSRKRLREILAPQLGTTVGAAA